MSIIKIIIGITIITIKKYYNNNNYDYNHDNDNNDHNNDDNHSDSNDDDDDDDESDGSGGSDSSSKVPKREKNTVAWFKQHEHALPKASELEGLFYKTYMYT